MNAFKLLSRATKASRSNSKASRLGTHPSAGDAVNPQVFKDEASPAPVKKRKLSHEWPEDVAGGGSLNFFGDNQQEARQDVPPRKRAEAPNEPGNDHDGASEDCDAPKPVDQDECRRILRAHRIKITTLWEPSALTAKENRKKRRRSETDPLQSKKHKHERLVAPVTSLSQLQPRYGLHTRIAENLATQGYRLPTEIQIGALPLLLGSSDTSSPDIDLLSVAPTGSGKTLSFLMPMLHIIKSRRGVSSHRPTEGLEAIIVAPTKELASQIVNEARKLARSTGIKVTLIRKGMKLARSGEDDGENSEGASGDEQSATEPRGQTLVKSSVIVATPGTMLQALSSVDKTVQSFSSVRHLVLDEADVLLDPLFREQTLGIWDACSNPSLRVSFWSATMGASIEDLVCKKLEQRWESLPQSARTGVTRAPLVRIVVGLKDSAVPNIQHKMIYAANEQGKLTGLRQLLHPAAASVDKRPALRPPFLVFTQTIERAAALHSELSYDIPIEAGGSTRIAVLHSNLSESSRDRIMTRFRKGELWVLITTDLLSRGVDFRGVNGVVNYDIPNSSAAYIHRVGRTGRAGREGGVAVTLYAEEDLPYVKNVANVIAASEKMNSGGEVDAMTRWLIESLPKITKRDRQQLKKRGVESRRPGKIRDRNGKELSKSRISTKSGFERREENRKKGAINASKARAKQAQARGDDDVSNDDDDFAGFAE